MRLVFVHGINNEGNSSARIIEEWTAWIEATLDDSRALQGIERTAPFYGDILHGLEGGLSTPEGVVAQGLAGEESAPFLQDALGEIAAEAGLSDEDLVAEAERLGDEQPQAMGLSPHDRRLIAIVRLLETVSPLQGRVALRLLNQAFIYLKKPAVTAAIDALVAEVLGPEKPTVVVAHSLGTIVTFKLLRAFAMAQAPRNVAGYITLGSPLALKSVKSALGRPRNKPQGVSDWLNARDPRDFVTLGRDLTRQTFADGIRNISDVRNPGADAHAIEGYLSDRRVAEAIAVACGVWPGS